MEPTTLVARAADLLSAPVDDEIVFLSLASDSYVALDAIGRRIWELLETPRTVGDLVVALREEFDAPPGVVETDVVAFLDELRHERLVIAHNPA